MAKTKHAERELTLPEIRAIALRHEGTMRDIARELQIRESSVSIALSGRSASKRIVDLARSKALALLEQERKLPQTAESAA